MGSNDNNLYALNSNGSLKWAYCTGGWVRSSPALGADGTVYLGSWDNNLYALNSNGSLKWSCYIGDTVDTSPALGADGTVYAGAWDNSLYAIHASTNLASSPWQMFHHDSRHTGQQSWENQVE